MYVWPTEARVVVDERSSLLRHELLFFCKTEVPNQDVLLRVRGHEAALTLGHPDTSQSVEDVVERVVRRGPVWTMKETPKTEVMYDGVCRFLLPQDGYAPLERARQGVRVRLGSFLGIAPFAREVASVLLGRRTENQREYCEVLLTVNVTRTAEDFVHSFLLEHDLRLCSWWDVHAFEKVQDAPLHTPYYHATELLTTVRDVEAAATDAALLLPMSPPVRTLCFDIETCNYRGRFDSKRDTVIIICARCYLGEEDEERSRVQAHTFLLDDPDHTEHISTETSGRFTLSEDPPPPNTFTFHTEASLLEAFAQYVREYDPDVVTGYNQVQFDMHALVSRATALGAAGVFDVTWGRLCQDGPLHIHERTFTSNQRGTITERVVRGCSGRSWIDPCARERKSDQLPVLNYRLDTVARHVLGAECGKLEGVTYEQIPELYLLPEGRLKLCEYCMLDVELSGKLYFKRMYRSNINGIAQLAGVTPSVVMERGQTVPLLWTLRRVSAGLSKQTPPPVASFYAFPVVVFFVEEEAEKQQQQQVPTKFDWIHEPVGGLVHHPCVGLHQDPVAVLDFASLYPSIIERYNVCFSTVGRRDAFSSELGEVDVYPRTRLRCLFGAGSVAGFEETPTNAHLRWHPVLKVRSGTGTSDMMDLIEEEDPTEPHVLCVARPTLREGLYPVVARTLVARRKALKRLMNASVPGSVEYATYDSQQLAAKVLQNSLYGVNGAKAAPMRNLHVARIVPLIGARLNMRVVQEVSGKESWEETLARMLTTTTGWKGTLTAEQLASVPKRASKLRCVYGDTDSVFVQAPGASLTASEMGAVGFVVERVLNTEVFRAPIALECENVYSPLFLSSAKKFYAALVPDMHAENVAGKPPKLKLKGYDRRDASKLVKEWRAAFFDRMFLTPYEPLKSVQSACLELTVQFLRRVDRPDGFPYETFQMTTRMSRNPDQIDAYMDDPSSRDSLPEGFKAQTKGLVMFRQAVLRARLEGDPEADKCLTSNDRITYVVREPMDSKVKVLERLMEVKKDQRPVPSRYYYIYNNLKRPMQSMLLDLGLSEAMVHSVFYTGSVKTERYAQAEIRTCKRARIGTPSLETFFKRV